MKALITSGDLVLLQIGGGGGSLSLRFARQTSASPADFQRAQLDRVLLYQ